MLRFLFQTMKTTPQQQQQMLLSLLASFRIEGIVISLDEAQRILERVLLKLEKART